jgi:hypothetical protein
MSELPATLPSKRGKLSREVKAHIYEISSLWQSVNASIPSMQAYHIGIEVYDWEYTFQYLIDDEDANSTGVVLCKPREASGYMFKESITLGTTPLAEYQVQEIINKLADSWKSEDYHPVNKNCVDFSRVLISELKIETELPPWVSTAADASKEGGMLGWLADKSWQGMKWFHSLDRPNSSDSLD